MISIYFGLPRCGKTTLLVKHAKKYVKLGYNVYVNIPCKVKGVIMIDNDMIGKYNMEKGKILIDEASIFADSRGYKNFPTKLVEWFSLHGHWQVDVELFCQIYNRVDSTIRQNAERVYMVKKHPILRFMSSAYKVPYGIAFSNQDGDKEQKKKYGEINEGYKAPTLVERITAERIYRPQYYGLFDTHWKPYELPPIPNIEERVVK